MWYVIVETILLFDVNAYIQCIILLYEKQIYYGR